VVSGEDVGGLSLVTRPAGTLEGGFVVDAGVTRPLPPNLRVSLRSAQGTGMTMTMGALYGQGFRLAGMSGRARIDVEGVPHDWIVKAILVNGEDLTDQDVEVNGETAMLRIVMTDRVTTVSGNVLPRGDRVDADGAGVVVFADDANRWRWPSRYVRVARTDASGHFEIRGLPPDARYLVAAVEYLEDGEEQDSKFLERLRGRATTVTLNEGEQRSVQLETIPR
jgi:hypothetical protein